MLESVRRVTGTIVSSQVSFLLRPDDNEAEYQCNASNAATTEPLVAVVTLKVSCTYPTVHAVVRQLPRVLTSLIIEYRCLWVVALDACKQQAV